MANSWREDRLARAAGKPAGTIPVVNLNPLAISALSLPEAYEWVYGYGPYTNEVTVKT